MNWDYASQRSPSVFVAFFVRGLDLCWRAKCSRNRNYPGCFRTLHSTCFWASNNLHLTLVNCTEMELAVLPNVTTGHQGMSKKNLSVWCTNYVPFPDFLDPCVSKLFCLENFSNPFLDPCDGLSQILSRSTGFFIIVFGIVSNILSLIAFSYMKMNVNSLFLMKCLALYDSLYLVGSFLTFGIDFLGWAFGYGYQKQSVYLYVERISYYFFFKICGSMSFWMIAVLTVER